MCGAVCSCLFHSRLKYWQVNVQGKQIDVSCGGATQRIKWLGHVGIARWDAEDFQGWTVLGVPTRVTRTSDGSELDLGATIRDVLQQGEQVTVETSMSRKCARMVLYTY